jgi:hypothetical protein
MKPAMQLVLVCLLPGGVFAGQHGGFGGGRTGGVAAMRPGGGRARVSIRTIPGHGRRRAYGSNGLYGGYYGPSYDYGYGGYGSSPEPETNVSNATEEYPPPEPPRPPQVAHPVIHEYARPADDGPAAGPRSSPILYRIAFRDSTIRDARAYWVQEGTLHYLDDDNEPQQAPLASVDRKLSAQLNRERGLLFQIQ